MERGWVSQTIKYKQSGKLDSYDIRISYGESLAFFHH